MVHVYMYMYDYWSHGHSYEQVSSASVSSAFHLLGKKEFEETAKFRKMFNKLFDCINTQQDGEGKIKRKPDLDPNRSDKDVRLQ